MEFYDPADETVRQIPVREWLMRRADSASRWHALRSIGSSRVSTLTVLTPVVGYLLIFNTNFDIFKDNWKLSWFYVGSLLFSAGTLIYARWCPGACKKYDSAVEYTTAEADFFTANANIMVKMVRRNLQLKPWPSFFKPNLKYIQKTIEAVEGEPDFFKRKPWVLTLMDEYWHLISPIHPLARIFCLGCYALGGFLIAVPSLLTVVEILWGIS